MAKKEKDINLNTETIIDEVSVDFTDNMNDITSSTAVQTQIQKTLNDDGTLQITKTTKPIINCLSNKKITIKHIERSNGFVPNKKNPQFGGLSENATRTFTLRKTQTGSYAPPLNDSEQAFLEQFMGLETGDLSIHKRVNNFWDTQQVVLKKSDTILNLADPNDFIKYKILLTNILYIAHSIKELETVRKGSWEFVIVVDNEDIDFERTSNNLLRKAYFALKNIEDDNEKLRIIVQILKGASVSEKTKPNQIQNWIDEEIKKNPAKFIKLVDDPLLDTKVLIFKCIEKGIIRKQGGQYIAKDKSLMICESNVEATLQNIATYINLPINSDVLISLEAQLTL